MFELSKNCPLLDVNKNILELKKVNLSLKTDLILPEFGQQKDEDKYISEKRISSLAKEFLDKIDLKSSFVKNRTILMIENMKKDFRLPIVGEQIRLRFQQQISLISIVLFVLHSHRKIKELTISTYTLNRESLLILGEMARKGRIEKINFLVASSYSFRDKKYFNYLKTFCKTLNEDGFNVHLSFAWIHLKITLMAAGENFYQMEGSLNYSTNNMAEQLLIENDQGIYNYDYNFINRIILNRESKAIENIC